MQQGVTAEKVGEGQRTTPPTVKILSAVDGRTVCEAYLRRVDLSGDAVAVKVKRGPNFVPITWNGVHHEVLGIFQFYKKLGIQKGDKIAIFSQSRVEWLFSDWANFAAGAITVPIYHSNSVEDVAFILTQSEAKLVFIEDEKSVDKLVAAFSILKHSLPIVTYFEDPAPRAGLSLTTYRSIVDAPTGPEISEAFRTSALSITPEMTASIVYTSGTTGQPKGAVLLHSNFTAEAGSLFPEAKIDSRDSTLTFLPFAHIMGRVESQISIFCGVVLSFGENINTVAKDIEEIKPTLLVSVPRIFEKIYAKIQSDVQSQPELKRNIFQWAVKVGKQVAVLRSEKKPVPLFLTAKFLLADRLVFSKIREKLGGRLRMSLSGGAPLSQDLCEFFHAAGIKIVEAYGLTETTAAIGTNRPDDYCFGTVGKILPGVELRLAEDGEIQCKGAVIFKEYYRNPQATKEAFTADGWFCTGDIGEINDRGFLKITDRKKELIVTSGGKKIAPQKLENLLKTCRFISNAMVYGDKQKYIVGLITLNEPEVAKWAKGKNLSGTTLAQLAAEAEVLKLVENEVAEFNKQLASFEGIKKVSLLPVDFTIETGELTPSLKVKRKVVTEKFKSYIEKMY
jgi:long-chain acyl-CoA synthetase